MATDTTDQQIDTDNGTGSESFQVTAEVAEVYESRFVPAIFGVWAPQLLDLAGVGPGDEVLDVACGTGIVARTALDRVRPGGTVTGVDLNEAMLGVARRLGPDVDWRQGDVAELPVDDASFDIVTCQMAFMFFRDPDAAAREMARAVRPGGRTAALVPAALVDQPAYRVFVDIAARIAGPDARPLLGAYWACGDLDRFAGHFTAAGLDVADRVVRSNPAHFGTVDDFVRTEIGGSPLSERIDESTIERISEECAVAMDQWVEAHGFDIPLVCNTVVARRPE